MWICWRPSWRSPGKTSKPWKTRTASIFCRPCWGIQKRIFARIWFWLPAKATCCPCEKASGCTFQAGVAVGSGAPNRRITLGAVRRLWQFVGGVNSDIEDGKIKPNAPACPALRPGSGCEPDPKPARRISRSGKGNERPARNLCAAEADHRPPGKGKPAATKGAAKKNSRNAECPERVLRLRVGQAGTLEGGRGPVQAHRRQQRQLLPQQGRIQQAGRLLPDHARNQSRRQKEDRISRPV